MNSRRLAIGGLAVFASATLALAGCTSSSATNAGGPSASATASSSAGSSSGSTAKAPKDAVLAAVTQLKTTSYKYTVNSGGLNGEGVADLPNKKISLTMTGTQSGLALTFDIVIIDTDMWLKMNLGNQNATVGIPTQWMHVDQTKLGKDASLGIDTSGGDPTDTTGIFDGIVDVQKVDDQHYNATFDLTKATGSSVNADTLKKLGAKATSVPGTVVLDGQGRLSSLTIDLSSVDPNVSIKNTFSDYGAAVSVTPPAKSETVEAPDSVYKMFGGS